VIAGKICSSQACGILRCTIVDALHFLVFSYSMERASMLRRNIRMQ